MQHKIRVWFLSVFLLSFWSFSTWAQLPDFVDMVKANGGAVVNIRDRKSTRLNSSI